MGAAPSTLARVSNAPGRGAGRCARARAQTPWRHPAAHTGGGVGNTCCKAGRGRSGRDGGRVARPWPNLASTARPDAPPLRPTCHSPMPNPALLATQMRPHRANSKETFGFAQSQIPKKSLPAHKMRPHRRPASGAPECADTARTKNAAHAGKGSSAELLDEVVNAMLTTRAAPWPAHLDLATDCDDNEHKAQKDMAGITRQFIGAPRLHRTTRRGRRHSSPRGIGRHAASRDACSQCDEEKPCNTLSDKRASQENRVLERYMCVG